MREIKFRYWNEQASRYHYGQAQVFTCLSQQTTGVYDHESDGCRFEQFTGLHDKNGKEIYEGDMLRDDYTDEDILIEDYSVVVWDKKFCQWAIDNSFAKDGSSFTNLVEYFGRETFEIVGNIFENADLVKL